MYIDFHLKRRNVEITNYNVSLIDKGSLERWYLKRTKGKSTKAILVDLALV